MIDSLQLQHQTEAAFEQRDWPRLGQLASALCQAHPDDGYAHYMTGLACLELGNVSVAIRYLDRARELEPVDAGYAVQYAKALSIAQQTNLALEAATQAVELQPKDAASWDILGVIFTRCQAYLRAKEAFLETTKRMPGSASFRYKLASTLITLGQVDSAEEALRQCLSLDPCHWEAHWALAQLGRKKQARDHVKQLETLLPRARSDPHAEVPVRVALFREYENLGEYTEAFLQLVAGKKRGKQVIGYDISRDETLFGAITRAFSEPLPKMHGHASSEPIFVLGMPRSGTTLLERIISSHPDVHPVGEIQNFSMVMKRLSGSYAPRLLDPETIACLGKVDWNDLGKIYIDSTRPNTGHTPHFIDKLPHNFLNIGYIAQSLPNASIICMRRHPLDTCLGNFRQLFMLGSDFCDYTFDLLDIGRYYVLFDRLMAHWRQLFPGRILEVDYEALVDNQEAVTRDVLTYCGLAWDEHCRSFENNPTPVDSASAVQVRSPVHRQALARWKHYRPQLANLQQLLMESGINVAG